MNRSDLVALELSLAEASDSIQRDLSKGRAATAFAAQSLSSRLEDLRMTVVRQRAALGAFAAQLGQAQSRAAEPSFVQSTLGLLDDCGSLASLVHRAASNIESHLALLSGKIGAMQETTTAVDKLARESRFIAFNARIQIQRARRSGETFKVIAEEVKRLAGETARLSLQINESVGNSKLELETLSNLNGQLRAFDVAAAVSTRTQLTALIAQVDQWHQAFEETMAHITNFIADAVRAIQFDDIVSQIFEGVSRKISALQPLIARSLTAAAMPFGVARETEAECLAVALAKLARTETLRQTSLEHNDIELF